MNKEAVLDKAKELISNERLKHYGPPKENFARIAKLWEVIFNQPITPAQVALCMAMVKVTRLVQTPDHIDSWVDLAGYSACGGEVSEKEAKVRIIQGDKNSISHWGIHEQRNSIKQPKTGI